MLRNIVRQSSSDCVKPFQSGELQTQKFTIGKNDSVDQVFLTSAADAACIGFSDHASVTRASSLSVVLIGSDLDPLALRWMDSNSDLIENEDVRAFLWYAQSSVNNYNGNGTFAVRAKRFSNAARIVQDDFSLVEVRVENQTRATFYTNEANFTAGGPHGATWRWPSVSSPFLATDMNSPTQGKTCTMNFYIN